MYVYIGLFDMARYLVKLAASSKLRVIGAGPPSKWLLRPSSSISSSSPGKARDDLKRMTSDHQLIFRDRSTWELARLCLVLNLCGVRSFATNAYQVMRRSKKFFLFNYLYVRITVLW